MEARGFAKQPEKEEGANVSPSSSKPPFPPAKFGFFSSNITTIITCTILEQTYNYSRPLIARNTHPQSPRPTYSEIDIPSTINNMEQAMALEKAPEPIPEHFIAANEPQAAGNTMLDLQPLVMFSYCVVLVPLAFYLVLGLHSYQEISNTGKAGMIGYMFKTKAAITSITPLANLFCVWYLCGTRQADATTRSHFVDACQYLQKGFQEDFVGCMFFTLGASCPVDLKWEAAGLLARAAGWVLWRQFHLQTSKSISNLHNTCSVAYFVC